jgi:hypothetical protein
VVFTGALALSAGARAQAPAPRLALSGDSRVRYEANTGAEAPDRHRGVLRLRLGATLRINGLFGAGARVVTGDGGDPRTADVTMSDFMDDLELSFDRAWLEVRRDGAYSAAGKFANPFATTELVWDADVNPAGIAGWVETAAVAGATPRLTGIYMVVDERSAASDASMWGAQLKLSGTPAAGWVVGVAAAYWDYTIPSLTHADDPGDTRGNRLTPDGGAYLSDFDLADVTVSATLPGLGDALPLRLVVDAVRNLGAYDGDDSGLSVEVYAGTPFVPRRFELMYGYARCETDAVLGAYSHDNLPLATNYRSHTLRGAYGVLKDTALSLTWYYFCRLERDPALPGVAYDDYSSRVRLDLMVRF